MKFRLLLLTGIAMLMSTNIAVAHTFDAGGAGFSAGFSHPLGGFDHVLAMLAAGLWATRIQSRLWWLIPVVFTGAMCAGASAGMAGMTLTVVELGVAGSVLLFGLLIATASKIPLWLALMMASLFAVCHGYAHAVEMPQAAAPLLYGLGFILATALLHLAGISVGSMVKAYLPAWVLRVSGAAIAANGVWLLAGL